MRKLCCADRRGNMARTCETSLVFVLSSKVTRQLALVCPTKWRTSQARRVPKFVAGEQYSMVVSAVPFSFHSSIMGGGVTLKNREIVGKGKQTDSCSGRVILDDAVKRDNVYKACWLEFSSHRDPLVIVWRILRSIFVLKEKVLWWFELRQSGVTDCLLFCLQAQKTWSKK